MKIFSAKSANIFICTKRDAIFNSFKLFIMKKPILILVYLLLITGIILGVLGSFNTISTYLYQTGIVLFAIGWIIVFFDMLKNKVHNKQFWVFSMFFVMPVTPIIYLIRRKNLIPVGKIK